MLCLLVFLMLVEVRTCGRRLPCADRGACFRKTSAVAFKNTDRVSDIATATVNLTKYVNPIDLLSYDATLE